MKEFIQVIISSIGGLLGAILGDVDGMLYALLLFIVIDYLTGVMAAIVHQKLSSQIGFKGIFKKIVLLFLVAVAYTIDRHLLQYGGAIRATVIFFYLSNEGLSILENAVRIGLPIPEKLKNLLTHLQVKDDKNEH